MFKGSSSLWVLSSNLSKYFWHRCNESFRQIWNKTFGQWKKPIDSLDQLKFWVCTVYLSLVSWICLIVTYTCPLHVLLSSYRMSSFSSFVNYAGPSTPFSLNPFWSYLPSPCFLYIVDPLLWPVQPCPPFLSTCPRQDFLARGTFFGERQPASCQIVSLTPTSLIPLKPEFRWGGRGVGQNRNINHNLKISPRD